MFPSVIKELVTDVPMPKFHGTAKEPNVGLRVLLMPIIFGDNKTVPYEDFLPMLDMMWKQIDQRQYKGQVVYLTIDQQKVKAGKTHRRPNLHVDGYPHTEADARYQKLSGIWAGSAHGGTWGGGGGWGGGNKGLYWWDGTGLMTISDVEGCRAWNQYFKGEPKVEGDCEHLRDECLEQNAITLKANALYWMSPSCVHESFPMIVDTKRTFVRLSLPSKCDWYEGCTPNPLGVKPAGKISFRRKFMDS